MRSDPGKPHSKYPHVYAIIRFDLDASPTNIGHSATVVKVFSSLNTVETEAARLREVNEGKDCTYVVQTTRFVGNPPTAVS
jgi:hypothetical protein